LKEAAGTVRRITGANEPFDQQKGEYETVLSYIVELLNKSERFSEFASAEIYEYTNKNQSNVLHLKGISYKKGESLSALSDELREWIQQQNMQWQIVNCFAAYV
jgi:ABC-type thiamine transport system substrate-binding protein